MVYIDLKREIKKKDNGYYWVSPQRCTYILYIQWKFLKYISDALELPQDFIIIIIQPQINFIYHNFIKLKKKKHWSIAITYRDGRTVVKSELCSNTKEALAVQNNSIHTPHLL